MPEFKDEMLSFSGPLYLGSFSELTCREVPTDNLDMGLVMLMVSERERSGGIKKISEAFNSLTFVPFLLPLSNLFIV
jgi:hypothetical protein